MQSSTPSKRSASSPQRQASEAPGQSFAESGSGSFLVPPAAAAASSSSSRRLDEPAGSSSKGSLEQLRHQTRLLSLVRNSNDCESFDRKLKLEEQDQDDEEEKRRLLEEEELNKRRLIWAEFADDSLRSQTGEAPGQYQKQQQVSSRRPSSRSVSLNSLKEQFNCFHQRQSQLFNSSHRQPLNLKQRHNNNNNNNHHNHNNHNNNNLRVHEFDLNDSHESQRLMSPGKDCFCRTEVTSNECSSRHCCSCQHHHNCSLNSTTTTNNHNHKDLDHSGRTAAAAATADKMGKTSQLIPVYFMAELIGTFLLVIIGDGSIGAYVLTRREVDTFCTCLAFGVGAMIATFACGKISGAHLNPAATLAFALDGQLNWLLVPVYLVAQYLGGFLAALVLFLNYSEAIDSLDGGQHTAFGSANSTGGIFATYPAPYVTVWGSLLDQIVGTAVLLFSLCAVCDTNNRAVETRQQPLVIALVIALVCVAFSPNCGAIFNPARDLSPRLLTALFGYSSVWEPIEGTYWILAGVVGPHMGAIIGVFAYKYLIGNALKAFERHAHKAAAASCQNHHASGGGHVCSEKPPQQLQQQTQTGQQQQQQLPCVQHYQLEPRHHELGDYGAAR